MTTVSLLGQNDAAEGDRPVLDAGVAAYGQVLNNWAAILNSPGLFATYLPFLRQVNGPGALDERIKELVALRVAVLIHCRYTTSHRYTSAKGKGVSEADLGAVARGDYSSFSEREQVALQLAEQVTTAVPTTSHGESRTGVRAQLLAKGGELFDDREMVELLMSVSMWNALARFHRVMDFDLDMPEPPVAVQELL